VYVKANNCCGSSIHECLKMYSFSWKHSCSKNCISFITPPRIYSTSPSSPWSVYY